MEEGKRVEMEDNSDERGDKEASEMMEENTSLRGSRVSLQSRHSVKSKLPFFLEVAGIGASASIRMHAGYFTFFCFVCTRLFRLLPSLCHYCDKGVYI